ncbi:hypothetical protein At15955_53730 (plasmid) [Agrobacterium tumefaciens]|uniref:Uncharacterized protein n=1 Tax=Agrobacterium tumefaciens TaxID=358 RepID=A0A2L2LLJ2_AGRTU|nr:hypothetical protein Ach5_51230 [Agrobacterium tumefaciens]AVH45203.1 hypothetical protein At1D1609_51690 [Agrobacterium tumefaciens]AYM20358.1 hypothetical protein At15955_53730 [Agrobacterium tumefaciens]AYM71659.1 hypothetical protein AtA6_54430 [Agrobacterium tumefaciens]
MSGTPIMMSLLEGIEDKACMCCPARPPSDNATGEDVDHEGHVDEALPSGDISTDMRKGFPGLSLMVQETLKRDPMCRHLFVFRGRGGGLIKVTRRRAA